MPISAAIPKCKIRGATPRNPLMESAPVRAFRHNGEFPMEEHDASSRREPVFGPDDLVTASELREFVFCERAWFLARQGYAVSPHAQAQRDAGVAFTRLGRRMRKRRNPNTIWWIVLLVLPP
jgi:hypothetical protein